MAALAAYRTRILQYLLDTGSAIWATAAIDESLRHALALYNLHLPLELETVLILPGDGREIALNSLTGLSRVTNVWWPYDSTTEVWPPNQIRGYHVYWDDARPVLFLDRFDGDQPQTDDELRIWYTGAQTIQDLDSATSTTVPDEHYSLLCTGAAGHAAMSRAVDLIETAGADLYGTGLLATWANARLREFTSQLTNLTRAASRAGVAYGEGWKLDKWDI